MPTIAELEKECGVEPGTFSAKPEVAAKLESYLNAGTAAQTAAEAKLADAQQKLDAAALAQRTIDDQIAQFGLTETKLAERDAVIAQLQAAQQGYTAAFAKLKEGGFNLEGIQMPQPVATQPPSDPLKDLVSNTSQGFANLQQAMDAGLRYQRIFGKPMPDDISILAQEAASRRLPIAAYAEQKYGFAAEQQKQQQAELAAKIQAGVDAGIEKYKQDHPPVAGNPLLTPGLPSSFPNLPKPRQAQDLRQFAGLPAKQKIAAALERATAAASTAAVSTRA